MYKVNEALQSISEDILPGKVSNRFFLYTFYIKNLLNICLHIRNYYTCENLQVIINMRDKEAEIKTIVSD